MNFFSLLNVRRYGFIFVLLYSIFGFISIFKESTGEISIPTHNEFIIRIFSVWALIAIVAYAFLIKVKIQNSDRQYIFFFFILFSIIFFVTWPFGSSDIFNYIFRSRVFVIYGENPYLVPPAQFPDDPMNLFVFWDFARALPMVYGPFWALISFIPTYIFQENIFYSLYFFKFIALLFTTGSGYLILKIAEKIRPQQSNYLLLMFFWNPLILFEFIQNGHNDIVMIFFLLLSLYFLFQKKYFFIFPVLLLSILTKYVSIIAIPFFLLFLIKNNGWRYKKTIVLSMAISFILFFIIFAHFGGLLNVFNPLFQRQFSEVNFVSILPLAIKMLFPFSWEIVRTIAISFFAIFYIIYLFICGKKKIFDEISLLKALFWIFLALFISTEWLMPWYFALPIIFSILIYESKYLHGAIFLTLMSLLSYGVFYIFFIMTLGPAYLFILYIYRVLFRKNRFVKNNTI